MSHQVIISFDVDETQIAENAAKEAGRQVAKDVLMEAFGASYERKELMRRYVYQAVKDIIDMDKDVLLREIVDGLVDSMRRTKMVRESLAKAVGEFESELSGDDGETDEDEVSDDDGEG